jgi:hypothetical protein
MFDQVALKLIGLRHFLFTLLDCDQIVREAQNRIVETDLATS